MPKVAKPYEVRQETSIDRCHRCGGMMVQEEVFELGSFDWRCVSCGERIDALILAHREAHCPKGLAREEAEKLFVGHGKSHLISGPPTQASEQFSESDHKQLKSLEQCRKQSV